MREGIKKLIKVDFLVGKKASRNWKIIIFTLVLCVWMIYNSHKTEQKTYIVKQLNDQVRELQSEFVDVRSQLQRARLESNVLESLKENGLKQSQTPPQKIKVIVKR